MEQLTIEDRIYIERKTGLKSAWSLFSYKNELILLKTWVNYQFILPLVCDAVSVIYQAQTYMWIKKNTVKGNSIKLTEEM